MTGFDLQEFRARRLGQLDDLRDLLLPAVQNALDGEVVNYDVLLEAAVSAFSIAWDELSGPGNSNPATFLNDVEDAIMRTTPESNPDRIATWLSTAAVGAATYYAAKETPTKTWVTMLDEDVREMHRPLHSVTLAVDETFSVGGSDLLYPGQPVGPPEVWINCRCILAVGLQQEELATFAEPRAVLAAAVEEEVEFEASDLEPEHDDIPWHGVLVVESKPSGDNRMFAAEALTWRDLPLPLTWQKASSESHGGSVVVGRIDSIERVGDELWGEGVFADSDEADEYMGLLTNQMAGGVSVDVDDFELQLGGDDEVDGMMAEGRMSAPKQLFTRGRISGATLVQIPAFAEARIQLGRRDSTANGTEVTQDDERYGSDTQADFRQISPEQRKKDAKSGAALPDGSYPIENVQDLKNAIQAIGRAKDPDKAKAHIRKRARALGHPELIPDTWQAEVEEFKRGAGWVTHPKETKTLHDYWVRGEGAGKIRWGTGGDFTRCTRQLRKYISPRFLNRTCAQWHHDALGYWPGELGKPGNPPNTPENRRRAARHASLEDSMETAPIANIVAAAPKAEYPAAWFANPALNGPTPLTVQKDGRVFGHLATWEVCHVGIDKTCVTAPHSATDYAYFHLGSVNTDNGEVSAGKITLNTSHADLDMDFTATARHYDHTGTIAAMVRAGEDEHGIWIAGAMCDVGDEVFRLLQASGGISGDWRSIGGNLELVGALAVNVPGFPVPRPALAASAGHQNSLVAAGMVRIDDPGRDIGKAIIEAMDQRDARNAKRERIAKLRQFKLEQARKRVASLIEV